MSHVAMPGESSPGQGTSLCKGPEAGEAREQGQAGVARGNWNGFWQQTQILDSVSG